MTFCNICNRGFRDNRDLNRHLSTLKHKNNILADDKSPLESQNDHFESQNDHLKSQNDHLDSTESKLQNTCKYCMKTFFKGHIKRHLLSCKQRDDPIRLLEIEQDICPVLPDSKTCCRFCEKDLTRVSILNKHLLICKDRIKYHDLLKEKSIKEVKQFGITGLEGNSDDLRQIKTS